MSKVTTVFPLSTLCTMIYFCLVNFFKALATSLLMFDLVLQLLALAWEEVAVSSNLFLKLLTLNLEKGKKSTGKCSIDNLTKHDVHAAT